MTLTHCITGDHSVLMMTVDYCPRTETAELVSLEILTATERIPMPEDAIDKIGERLMAEVDWAEIYADQDEVIIENE